MYVKRPLASSLLNCTSKVAILEGARAVGKTSLARNELVPRGFSYYSLSDQSEYNYALNNLTEWVNSLSLPAVIDEAQRIGDLPLAIKDRVDHLQRPGVQVVLTGSASINRKGLEGQDPLARRSRRFTLHPLTRREINGVQRSIIDDLWEGTLDPTFRTPLSRQELCATIALGGFPRYAIEGGTISSRERFLSIRDDIDGILGDTILPGEQLDKTIAHAVLKGLLSLPGGILNISRLSNSLGYDARTITRYISIFERRYLVHSLPNLRSAAHKQTVAHSKIHPVDASFSYELLTESGKDLLADPVLFGGIFESFVINQIVSAIPWSRHLPDKFYWREPGSRPKEVDLVLVSGEELIGVEVKASSSISGSDFNGLKALSSDSRFMRGYVVYTGEKVVKVDENMWALPVSALWERDAFIPQKAATIAAPQHKYAVSNQNSEEVQPADAQILLSYSHEDNDYLDGAIVRLAEDIAREYRFQYGTDIKLFVDEQSINWEEQWQSALSTAVDATTFIMPSITPGYISSAACRDELQRFVGRVAGAANCHVLSLLWQQYRGTASERQNPAIVRIIEEHQHEDVSALRDLAPSDKTYRLRVRELAEKIRDNILEDQKKGEASQEDNPEAPTAIKQRAGLIEQMQGFTRSAESFANSFTSAIGEFQRVQEVITSFPVPQQGSPDAFAAWCSKIEESARKPVESMRRELSGARAEWNDVCKITGTLIDAFGTLSKAGQEVDVDGLRMQLVSMRAQFDQLGDLKGQLAPLSVLPVLSPRLRFLADGLNELVNTVEDMSASLNDLIGQTEAVRP